MTASALDELDFDYAVSVAQQAQALMAQHRVLPTPDNFAVWFKFALGTSPQLKQAINVLIGNKRKFDTPTNRDLYRAYVGGKAAERAIDLGVSEQLSALMAGAQQFLAVAIDDNRLQLRARRRIH
jgi:diguanylate cyclase